MTPFYSSLALWVGGIVLVAVISVELNKKEREKVKNPNTTQMFFGRYLLFFFIGQIQALIIGLGDLYFLKIQCNNPGPFKALSPFLPFKYGINALRETVAGVDISHYVKDIEILLVFIIPAVSDFQGI